jgi:hypothetical protein
MLPSFIQGFRTAIWVFATICVLVSLCLYYADSYRAAFVQNHVAQTCTIKGRHFSEGKSNTYTWSLSCAMPIQSRSVDVSQPEYEASKIGQEVPIYFSKDAPGIWERFEPTSEWRSDLRLKSSLIFVTVAVLIALVFIAIWKESVREVDRLGKANIVDAEVIGIIGSDSKGEGTKVKLRFQVKGQPYEGTFSTTSNLLGNHFETRTVKMAVDEDNPSESRILEMYKVAELIPMDER